MNIEEVRIIIFETGVLSLASNAGVRQLDISPP